VGQHQLAKRGQHRVYAIVDSLPLKLCHPFRMDRTKRFRREADIGYCASKKIVFKLYPQISNQGVPMGYAINEASCV